MGAEWLLVLGLVRFFFAFAPLVDTKRDFSLPEPYDQEAMELSQAATGRSMLALVPIVFLVSVVFEAGRRCGYRFDPLGGGLLLLAMIFLAWRGLRFRTDWLRGSRDIRLCAVAATAAEVAGQVLLLPLATGWACRA